MHARQQAYSAMDSIERGNEPSAESESQTRAVRPQSLGKATSGQISCRRPGASSRAARRAPHWPCRGSWVHYCYYYYYYYYCYYYYYYYYYCCYYSYYYCYEHQLHH